MKGACQFLLEEKSMKLKDMNISESPATMSLTEWMFPKCSCYSFHCKPCEDRGHVDYTFLVSLLKAQSLVHSRCSMIDWISICMYGWVNDLCSSYYYNTDNLVYSILEAYMCAVIDLLFLVCIQGWGTHYHTSTANYIPFLLPTSLQLS